MDSVRAEEASRDAFAAVDAAVRPFGCRENVERRRLHARTSCLPPPPLPHQRAGRRWLGEQPGREAQEGV